MENTIKNKGQIMLERVEKNFFEQKENPSDNESGIILLDNVQFIYELSLAELELKALNVEFKNNNGLRDFAIINNTNGIEEKIIKQSSYFKSVYGKPTDYYKIIQKNQTRSVNQYLTHWIYPYKGKFHPQMIRALLNIIGLKKGDVVFEPYSGSGTTALEAQLLGINTIGIDISPLCVFQGRVKTESLFVYDELLKIKNNVLSLLNVDMFNDETNYFKSLENLTTDERVRNFYIMVRLLSISDESRRKRDFKTSFLKNLNLMLESVNDHKNIVEELSIDLGNIEIKFGDSRNTRIDSNSVDGIITSPPYSIALDYVENDEHSLKDLGYDITKIREDFIGVRGTGKKKVELYNDDMMKSYNEMYRILKPGKFAVIVIGNATYAGNEVKTVEFTIDYMQKTGFTLTKNINKIIFGLYNVMKKENILIFQK